MEDFYRQCGVDDCSKFAAGVEKLYELLSVNNAEFNLTRIVSKADFLGKHVADSLAVAKFFKELNGSLDLLDVGCGAGFPSLILALAFPTLRITALDSIAKKTKFVEQAARELSLDNLRVVTARSRELNRQADWQQQFDVITARAVSDLRTLFRESKNLLRQSGKFIFFKTPQQAEAELPNLQKFSEKSGYRWQSTESFSLPNVEGKRLFVYSSYSNL